MGGKIFDSDSVIQEDTDIDSFRPPYPGWNYVRLLYHPDDNLEYNEAYCGKWLLFVPDEEFLQVFRSLCKLVKDFNLTHCFKASGTPDEKGLHVFCVYCSDCRDFKFVKKIAKQFNDLGFLKKYGYTYRDGHSAIYFKTDGATHYKSMSRGSSITLFRYMDDNKLYIKKFEYSKPSWILVDDSNPELVDEFIMSLHDMETLDGEY
jgi:hypothetical protein